MTHQFTDNRTGAVCNVVVIAPHKAVLMVSRHVFGFDVSDFATFERAATKIIDASV